jgi:CheY-like chemotaxis protein
VQCIGPKILIADDEPTIARMWEIIFSQLGFQVVVCFDGHEALKRARTWHPDLFVTDIQMPHMNGVQAALRVHKLFPACAIVIVSASSEISDELTLIRRHHLAYLQKPVAPSLLIGRLEEMLAPPGGKIGPGRVTLADYAQRRAQ